VIQEKIAVYLETIGLFLPIICTPEELLGGNKMTDEIMMEVHAIKDAIGVKYGNNLDALFKEIQLGEARLKAAGFQVFAPPVNPENLPNTALQRTRFARR